MTDYSNTLSEAVQNGDRELVSKTVSEALDAGVAPQEILGRGLIPGIQALGERFKEGQVYLPEILISTRAMRSGVEVLSPHLAGADVPKRGIVVIGTVEGDMHDIGKNLVKVMLETNGFDVYDLGVDVPAGSFVTAVKEASADIVALSALLTTTMVYIPDVVKRLEQAGLKGRVKVMIGGAPTTRSFADEAGAEGYADDCVSAVDEAARLMNL